MGETVTGGSRRRGYLAAGIFVGVAHGLVACPQLAGDDFSVIRIDTTPPDGSTPDPPDSSRPPNASADAGPTPSDERDAAPPSHLGDSGVPEESRDGGAEAPIDWAQCTLSVPEPISGLGFSVGSEFGPALSADAFELIFSSTSPGNEDLFRATRPDRGLVFSLASPLTALNGAAVEGTAFIAVSGLHLYFQSTRSGGPGGRDLYMARRATASAAFESPELLPDINSVANDQYPRLSPDELTLGFTSARAGGQGSNDLWIATRSAPDSAFTNPTPVVELNGPSNDEGGTLTSDGRCIFFNSDRLGTLDLYMATRATAADKFSAPINLVALNTSQGEFNPLLTRDDRELFFSSNRGTSGGEFHIFRAHLECPEPQ